MSLLEKYKEQLGEEGKITGPLGFWNFPLLSRLLIRLLGISPPPPPPPPDKPSIITDKTTYSVGETMKVYGYAHNKVAGATMTLYVNLMGQSPAPVSNTEGYYEIFYTFTEPGHYDIYVYELSKGIGYTSDTLSFDI